MSNSPKLSHEDRVNLATLAIRKSFDYNFLKTMDIDNNSETSMSIDSNQYSDYINSDLNKENEIENKNLTNNFATLTEDNENVSINMELELESLKTKVDRIKTLASENNNSTFVLKSIKNLKNHFQHIISISD